MNVWLLWCICIYDAIVVVFLFANAHFNSSPVFPVKSFWFLSVNFILFLRINCFKRPPLCYQTKIDLRICWSYYKSKKLSALIANESFLPKIQDVHTLIIYDKVTSIIVRNLVKHLYCNVMYLYNFKRDV